MFNGEVCVIADFPNPGTNTVQYSNPPKRIEYPVSDWKQLELAYALTIHKSQGSELHSVYIILHSQQWIMLRRELLYSAVTRSSQGVTFFVQKKGFNRAVSNNEIGMRYRGLLKYAEN